MTKAPDTIGELMTADVVTVAPEATVRDALRAMLEHDLGSVVVTKEDAAVGVFTERDLTRHVLTDAVVLDKPVHQLMATPPITVAPSEQVIDVFDLMNAKRIRRLLVVEGGRLVGIVTEGDLRRWVGQVAKE